MPNTLNPASLGSTGYVGNYGQTYIDAVSLSGAVPEFKEQVYAKLFQREGEGAKLLDLMRIAGNEFFVKGERLTAFEELGDKKTVAVAAAGPAATGHTAGDPLYFKVSSADYDASGNLPLRVGDVVYLPGAKFNVAYPVAAQVFETYTSGTYGGLSAGTGANRVYGVKVLEGKKLQSDLGTPTLLVGHTAFGRGAGQPAARFYANYQRDFYTGISKETVEIVGGVSAMERQVVFEIEGQPRIWDAGLARAEFALDKQIEHALWLSNLNIATTPVALSNTESGEATKTKTTKGFLRTISELGSKLTLDTAFNGLEDFDDIRELQLSQNVVAGVNLFLCNPKLYTQVENTMLNAGDNGGITMYDKELQMFGIPFKRVMKNNRLFYLIELPTLASLSGLGATTLGSAPNGFVIPLENVATSINTEISYQNVVYTPQSGKVSLPNIGIGYLNNNGENRRKVINVVAGVNGMNIPASNQYDTVKGYMLSEYMLFLMGANKIVWVTA